jgi:hypothetical protein
MVEFNPSATPRQCELYLLERVIVLEAVLGRQAQHDALTHHVAHVPAAVPAAEAWFGEPSHSPTVTAI